MLNDVRNFSLSTYFFSLPGALGNIDRWFKIKKMLAMSVSGHYMEITWNMFIRYRLDKYTLPSRYYFINITLPSPSGKL